MHKRKKFVRACIAEDIDACGDTRDEIEDFYDASVKPLEQAVLSLGLRRRPQLTNMKRIRILSLPLIKLSMKNMQKALHQSGGLHAGKKLSSLSSQRTVISYIKHVAMAVPNSFDEDNDYLSVERPPKALHMNAQASLFLQAIKAYCQRSRMSKTNSGVPKFPDCLTEDDGKTGRVLIVGIVRGLLGRGLSNNMDDSIASYSKTCHETDRIAIDLVWELYPLCQRWCANFVIPVQYMSGLGCVPLMEIASINSLLDTVDEWLTKYEDTFSESEGPHLSNDHAESDEESSVSPDVVPATPVNTTVRERTPGPAKRKRARQNMMNRRVRRAIE